MFKPAFVTDCVVVLLLLVGVVSGAPVRAVEVFVIDSSTKPEMDGKELDWIYGDYVLSNDLITVVVAAPLATRDANLTVRDIGASILDLSLNHPSNDQLSAYIPTGGRYGFHDPSQVEMGSEGDTAYWQCSSSKSNAGDETTATVRYELRDGEPFVSASVTVSGDLGASWKAFDGVRADGSFDFKSFQRTAYCADEFFRQTIGFRCSQGESAPTWKRGRPNQLQYSDEHLSRDETSVSWSVDLYPATSPIDLHTVAEDSALSASWVQFQCRRPLRDDTLAEQVARYSIDIQPKVAESADGNANVLTDDYGLAFVRLPPGEYSVKVNAIGQAESKRDIEVGATTSTVDFDFDQMSGFDATVTDETGASIPVKATIYAVDGEEPDFGPSSTRTFVENCVYSVHGQFRCPLDPGTYDVLFSRGPEYNSVSERVVITEGRIERLDVQLDRVLDTSGWVSADLHSHSSPSGDNTSDQYGRVENLLCENIEFAPCTEHNRISSYEPHLDQMQLSNMMATCTGMELTGSLLPVNHQNSFPLHHHPHTQNGGGPRVSSNPVVQIERLAMWDKGSDKVVQMNHPNLHQIYGDLDTDGVPDSGFRGMLDWTDVIEVHPLETLFQDVAAEPPSVRRMRIPMFQWLQLLNQGYRIPGVVNTDAHYNHHGSGWRRIWIASSTDDPAKISTDEMVRETEAGHIIMSTGPYLSVTATSNHGDQQAIPGDDLSASDGKVKLAVTVQCPNWLDVNRVQVFVNGRPSAEHNYTRRSAGDAFKSAENVTRFDAELDLVLAEDAHVIVATIGEGLTMERVMGSQDGKRPPIAVANPIFVDVDGGGFDHNHDELGLPLPETRDES